MSKADTVSEALCDKLTNARGVVTIAQAYASDNEMFHYALQAALDLMQEADDLAAKLGQLAGAKV
ncbi:MAG: hypothetical protein AABZ67_17060 [Pseudomonadota bacterium]